MVMVMMMIVKEVYINERKQIERTESRKFSHKKRGLTKKSLGKAKKNTLKNYFWYIEKKKHFSRATTSLTCESINHRAIIASGDVA